MGAELSLLAPTAQTIAVSAYIDFLPDIQYSKPLGSSRFLKTIKCLDKNGAVVVKLLVKPPNQNLNLLPYLEKLENLRIQLTDLPNVLPFHTLIDSDRATYLIRAFVRYNLYDRVSIRPFLESIEKKWIAYQLLFAVAKLHEREICHGDLKTENVLLTSWNWCLITDFGLFKPVYLPDNNPSQFSFYFDTSQRHSCYLAPERFVSLDQVQEGVLKPAMDIFSLGCVIAELYTEGLPIFTLPQTFKYKKGEYSPNLDAVEDLNVRRLIQSMISLNPDDRLSAKEYLINNRKTIFPDHFYTFLHSYIKKLSTDISSQPVASNYNSNNNTHVKFKECDTRIDKIYQDFDKIALYLEFKNSISEQNESNVSNNNEDTVIPIELDLPGMHRHIPQQTSKIFTHASTNDCSSLILLSIVLNNVRNTTHSSFRIKACGLILAFAEQLHDEAKLDRCLPYLANMLDDPSEDLQTVALRSMTQLLTMVDVITPINVYVFPEYILPKLQLFLRRSYMDLSKDSNGNLSVSKISIRADNFVVNSYDGTNQLDVPKGSYVRMIFACCLPHLAMVSKKFYEMATLLKNQLGAFHDPDTDSNVLVGNGNNADYDYNDLVEGFENLTIQILTDSDPYVKIALMRNILPLCAFFGKEKTNDVILSHLITYLNDKNPQIKLSFVSSIVSLSIFVGVVSLEQYILPLLVQALYEPDELIIIDLLKVFTELVKLGLIRKDCLWDLINLTVKLLLHPNELIRQSVLNLLIAVGSKLSLADLYCMLYPLIRPFFQHEVTKFTWENLYISVYSPLSRAVFNVAKQWSLTKEQSLFWQKMIINDLGGKKMDSFGNTKLSFMKKKGISSQNLMYRLNLHSTDSDDIVNNYEVPLSIEDLKQVEKLKSVGFNENELWKIATLRSYIYRVARLDARNTKYKQENQSKNLNILPRSVFVDITHTSDAPNSNSPTQIETITNYKNPATLTVQKMDSARAPIVKTKSAPFLLLTNLKKPIPSVGANDEVAFGESSFLNNSHYSGSCKTSMFDNVGDANVYDETLNLMKITTTVQYSYQGYNPFILKFLNSMKFEPDLKDYAEFGISVEKVANMEGITSRTKDVYTGNAVLIGRLIEHKASINCIVTSPDHKYFITGDDHGVLKIWETSRLELDVTGDSRLSLNLGSAIKSLTFMSDRHCFAVATKDGYIKLFRVDFISNVSKRKLNRYKNTSITLIRHYRLEKLDLYATQILFSITREKPYLVFSTPTSKIIILDIRTMTPVNKFQNDVMHGVPLTFAIDQKQTWLILGTSKGVLDLWDISVGMRVRSTKFKNTSYPITRLSLLPEAYELNGAHGRFVTFVGGTGEADVTIWDVSRMQPRVILCSTDVNTASTIELYSVKEVIDDVEESLVDYWVGRELLDRNGSSTAICVETKGNQVEIVSATKGRKIIEWNLRSPENSRVVVDSLYNGRVGDIPVYIDTQINSNLSFVHERYTARTKLGKEKILKKKPIDSMINKGHQDRINDLVRVKKPYNLLVSVDRSGVINVYK